MCQLVLAHPFSLDREIAVRETWKGVGHSRRQRINNWILHVIRLVPTANGAIIGPPTILGFLGLDPHIHNHGQNARIVAQNTANFLGSLATFVGRGIRQPLKGLGIVQHLVIQMEFHCRHRFIKQTRPRIATGRPAFVDVTLKLFAQLKRLAAANTAEPASVTRNGGVTLPGVDHSLVDGVELEIKKHKFARNTRVSLHHVLLKAC